jgi:hypothetical protein
MSVTIGSIKGFNSISGSGLNSIPITLTGSVSKGDPTIGKYLVAAVGYYGYYPDNAKATITDNVSAAAPYYEANSDLNDSSQEFGYPALTEPHFGITIFPFMVLNDLSVGNIVNLTIRDGVAPFTGIPLTTSLSILQVRLHEVSGFAYSINSSFGFGNDTGSGSLGSPYTSTFSLNWNNVMMEYVLTRTVGSVTTMKATPEGTATTEQYSFDITGQGHIGYVLKDYTGSGIGTTTMTVTTDVGSISAIGAGFIGAGAGKPYPNLGVSLRDIEFRGFQ